MSTKFNIGPNGWQWLGWIHCLNSGDTALACLHGEHAQGTLAFDGNEPLSLRFVWQLAKPGYVAKTGGDSLSTTDFCNSFPWMKNKQLAIVSADVSAVLPCRICMMLRNASLPLFDHVFLDRFVFFIAHGLFILFLFIIRTWIACSIICKYSKSFDWRKSKQQSDCIRGPERSFC